MSLYTALVIQNPNNDIRCEPYGQDEETKKWAGAVNQYHGGIFHTTLLSSEPAFDTSKESVEYMENVVKLIRDTNLAV